MSRGNRSEKVRVLIVTRWPVGGIRSYLRYTYGLLPPERLDLVVLGPGSSELEESRDALAAFQPRLDATPSSSVTAIARGVFRALQREPFDIVHSQGYSSALAAALPVSLHRLPHIVTIHDMFTDVLRDRWSVRVGRLVLASALGLVDIIQPTGSAVEANFRRHMNLWPATRPAVRTMRNGIDVSRFAGTTRRDLRAELRLGVDDFLIGFLGRFMAIKGFHCLIAAIEQLQSEGSLPGRPVVVAVGSGGFVREDRALIERKGLSEHFRFLPHTNQVAQTLRGLDVVAIPSFSEASPILPMEALCSGVPVIASECPGLIDVLQGTPARMFPVGNSASMAQALLEEMRSPRTAAVAAFRAEAAARFDAGNTARSIGNLVFELTGRDALPPEVNR